MPDGGSTGAQLPGAALRPRARGVRDRHQPTERARGTAPGSPRSRGTRGAGSNSRGGCGIRAWPSASERSRARPRTNSSSRRCIRPPPAARRLASQSTPAPVRQGDRHDVAAVEGHDRHPERAPRAAADVLELDEPAMAGQVHAGPVEVLLVQLRDGAGNRHRDLRVPASHLGTSRSRRGARRRPPRLSPWPSRGSSARADPRHRPPLRPAPHRTAGGLLAGRIDTEAQLRRALARVEASGERVDALVISGDLADSGDPAAYELLRDIVRPGRRAARLRARAHRRQPRRAAADGPDALRRGHGRPAGPRDGRARPAHHHHRLGGARLPPRRLLR